MSEDNVIYELEGISGHLYVYENRVVIERKGLKSSFFSGNGSTTIKMSDIKAVQHKHIDMTSGFIRFATVYGGSAQGGIWTADKDENAVVFLAQRVFQEKKVKMLNDLSDTIADYVEKQIEKYSSQYNAGVAQVSTADEIKKFKDLLDNGVISEEEFNLKKKQLLGL